VAGLLRHTILESECKRFQTGHNINPMMDAMDLEIEKMTNEDHLVEYGSIISVK